MTEKKDDKAKKKYLDKFDSDDELAKAYAELEKKLGSQGEEVGTLKKQFEEAQKALGTYAQQLQELQPYAQWYQANQNSINLYNQWLQSGGQGPMPAGAAPAASAAGNKGLVDLLTPEEKKALFSEFVQTFDGNVFKPWQQNFAQQLERLATERQQAVLNAVTQNQRAFTEVLWRTMQHGLPEDKINAMREWHNKAIELGDPQKYDPMKAADDFLSMQSRLSSIEAEKKALEAEREKWQRESLPTFNGGRAGSSWTKVEDDVPADKYDRMDRVFKETQEKVGRDAFKEAFGGR